MNIELTQQEAEFIERWFKNELEEDMLSNFTKTMMINIIQKLRHD